MVIKAKDNHIMSGVKFSSASETRGVRSADRKDERKRRKRPQRVERLILLRGRELRCVAAAEWEGTLSSSWMIIPRPSKKEGICNGYDHSRSLATSGTLRSRKLGVMIGGTPSVATSEGECMLCVEVWVAQVVVRV